MVYFIDNNFTLQSLATNHHNNHISIIVNEIILFHKIIYND